MNPLGAIPPTYRAAAVAVVVSSALHGVAVVGVRAPFAADEAPDLPEYSATLVPAVAVEPPPAPPPVAPPPRTPRRSGAVAFLPEMYEGMPAPRLPDTASLPALEDLALAPPPPALKPEVVALAQPSAQASAPRMPVFPREALPAELTIAYSLTSLFADGKAEYSWRREGDRYVITGTAKAIGIFAIFLEGQIEQEARGRVTAEGLRPDRFTEKRGNTPEEGLVFDWDAGKVEFRKGEEQRTGGLKDATVDWLSMIFQLAHMPPNDDSFDLHVYTQRRLYDFQLQLLGLEELDLPFGRATTLHLRHAGEGPDEAVDVWLGVDQYFLPVKLRYPVARNRLIVEQTATSVRAR